MKLLELECYTLNKAKVNEIQLLLTDAKETAFVLWQQLPRPSMHSATSEVLFSILVDSFGAGTYSWKIPEKGMYPTST